MRPTPRSRCTFSALLLAAAIAGCDAPEAARFELSDEARRAPEPQLVPTAGFASALEGGASDSARIAADRDALAARAASLDARAAALAAAPVIPPPERTRLEQASGAR